jgi:hypothetical protein
MTRGIYLALNRRLNHFAKQGCTNLRETLSIQATMLELIRRSVCFSGIEVREGPCIWGGKFSVSSV